MIRKLLLLPLYILYWILLYVKYFNCYFGIVGDKAKHEAFRNHPGCKFMGWMTFAFFVVIALICSYANR